MAESSACPHSTSNVLRPVVIFIVLAALFCPLYIKIGGAPIYIVQSLLLPFVLVLLLLTNKFIRTKSEINTLVIVYFCWVLISYFVSILYDVLTDADDNIVHRTVSLAFFFLNVVSYYLALVLVRNESNLKSLIFFSRILFVALLLYCLKDYLFAVDLYQARQSIGQRLPLVLVYLSWILCSGFLLRHEASKYALLCIFALSTVVVALSLTRAAYIQWFVSLVFFLVICRVEINKKRLVVISFFVFVAVGWLAISSGFFELISDRIFGLFNPHVLEQQDISVSIRTTIWKEVITELFNSPFHLIFGQGQLGSSYMDISFISALGFGVENTSAHSQYLDVIVRSGVVGLVFELLIIFTAIYRSLKLRKLGIFPSFFGGNAIALIGILAYGVFHESLRWQMFGFIFWFYLGVVSGWDHLAKSYRSNGN